MKLSISVDTEDWILATHISGVVSPSVLVQNLVSAYVSESIKDMDTEAQELLARNIGMGILKRRENSNTSALNSNT